MRSGRVFISLSKIGAPDRVTMLSHYHVGGCSAYKWIVHMRDRGLTAQCYELDRSSDDDAKPKNLPDPYDGLLKP